MRYKIITWRDYLPSEVVSFYLFDNTNAVLRSSADIESYAAKQFKPGIPILEIGSSRIYCCTMEKRVCVFIPETHYLFNYSLINHRVHIIEKRSKFETGPDNRYTLKRSKVRHLIRNAAKPLMLEAARTLKYKK